MLHLEKSLAAFEEAKPQLAALVKRQKLGEKLAEMRNNAMVELNEDVVREISAEQAAMPSSCKMVRA